MQKIKCLLLAAGFGTRLRPITDKIPKCLVKIGGQPILMHWINKLDRIQCNDIIINTHYLAGQVNEFIDAQDIKNQSIKLSHEIQLLGTAGTLLKHRDFFKESDGILIHADNATKIELNEFVEAHFDRPSNCILTMLTFTTDTPSTCGIIEKDHKGIVRGFHEKSMNPPGNIANGAVYMFDNRLFDHLSNLGPEISDFSTQVLPSLVGKIFTYHTDATFIDIGTPENLERARVTWQLSDRIEQ